MNNPEIKEIRKQIAGRLKKLVEQKVPESDLRNLDAISGKDHSWIGKIFKGEQNFTIDSLIKLLIQFKIQPKELFNFRLDFSSDD